MNILKHLNLFLWTVLVLSVMTSCEVQYSEDGIQQALTSDSPTKIKKLLEKVDADTLRFDEGRNLLQLAMLRGANNVSKYLMETYKLQDSTDDYGYTALHIAILRNYDEQAELLINGGSNLNLLDAEGYSPLHYATARGKRDLVKSMNEKGADINLTTTVLNSTPLHIAVEAGDEELTKFFRSKKVIDTITDENGYTAKLLALESRNPKIVNIYFDSFTKDEKNILLYNTIRNDSATTQIEKWIDQIWVDKNTLQEAFVFVQHPKMASLLLNNGVAINKLSKAYGYGAIHQSSIRGDLKMLKFLVENGADVNKISESDMSPLMNAAMRYDDVLIKQDVGGYEFTLSQSYLDNFEMSYAKNTENSLAAVKFLLENKANLNFTNKEKENALYFAASTFNTDVVDYLMEKGITETKPFKETDAERRSRVMDKISQDALLNSMNSNY